MTEASSHGEEFSAFFNVPSRAPHAFQLNLEAATPVSPTVPPSASPTGRVLYVSANAAGNTTGEGSGWGNAYKDLNAALAVAQPGDQIWVSAGTYAPTSTGDRSAAFQLKPGVSVLGGFNGTETQASQRDFQKNTTILSGEIGNKNSKEDNSLNVVRGAKDAVLDGFTVQGGNAIPTPGTTAPPINVSSDNLPVNTPLPPMSGPSGPLTNPGNSGAPGGSAAVHLTPEAILADAADGAVEGAGGGISITEPMTLNNLVITENQAVKGGGVYVMTANKNNFPPGQPGQEPPGQVTFENVTLHNNLGKDRGAGFEAELGANVVFTNSRIENNTALNGKGGGGYLDFLSQATLINTSVTGNKAASAGGLGSDGGGSFFLNKTSITQNSATDEGGGLYLGTGESNKAIVVDSLIENNQSGGSGSDSFVWHNNQLTPLNSLIKSGDVMSQSSQDASKIGANPNTPVTGKAVIDILDSFAPYKPQPPVNGMPPTNGAPPANGTPPVNSTVSASSVPTPQSDRIVFVNSKANASSPIETQGKSWGSAYTSLSDALADAAKDGAQVWVAEGTYKPEGTDREATFKLGAGVRLFGGFAGNETAVEQRNLQRHRTKLSGDIGKLNVLDDNTYHVITGGQNASIDGVIVEDGNADGTGYNGHGGGMVNYENTVQGRPNQEAGFSVKVANSIFKNNHAHEGGAIYNYGNTNNHITNSIFMANSADNGGAIVDRVGVKTNVENTLFFNNEAKYSGGGYYVDYGSRPTLKNSIFANNQAGTDGGGLYSVTRASQLEESISTLASVIFAGNSAGRNGGAAAINDNSVLNATHSMFFANTDSTGNGRGIAQTQGSKITLGQTARLFQPALSLPSSINRVAKRSLIPVELSGTPFKTMSL